MTFRRGREKATTLPVLSRKVRHPGSGAKWVGAALCPQPFLPHKIMNRKMLEKTMPGSCAYLVRKGQPPFPRYNDGLRGFRIV